jgi:Protein involved in biosynthesis of mitomycin antibiotics/polyketide fumonisin
MNALASQYRERGYVVLEDIFDVGTLQSTLSSLKPLESVQRFNKSGQLEFCKIPNLAKRQSAFHRLASNGPLVDAVEGLLGQEALIFRDVLVSKPAKAGASLDYHQDSEYWDVEPRALVSAWIPFCDVTAENGCLRVIEGSHGRHYPHDINLGKRSIPSWVTALLRRAVSLAGTGDSDASGFSLFRGFKNSFLGGLTRYFGFLGQFQDLHARVSDLEREQEITLSVRAGSVILFHSMLLHASNSNNSDSDRVAYIVSYLGANYTFRGVGTPEFLVARESDRQVSRKVTQPNE